MDYNYKFENTNTFIQRTNKCILILKYHSQLRGVNYTAESDPRRMTMRCHSDTVCLLCAVRVCVCQCETQYHWWSGSVPGPGSSQSVEFPCGPCAPGLPSLSFFVRTDRLAPLNAASPPGHAASPPGRAFSLARTLVHALDLGLPWHG